MECDARVEGLNLTRDKSGANFGDGKVVKDHLGKLDLFLEAGGGG